MLLKLFLLLFCYTLNLFAHEQLNLPLRGQSEFKWYFFKIYDAKLFADAGDNIYTRPLILALHYQRNFKGNEIVDQSLKELAHAGMSEMDCESWKSTLLTIFPDVIKGDTIKAYFYPKKGIIFYLNDTKELGHITELNFSRKFLDIWLGERTTAPELRSKLLGIKP